MDAKNTLQAITAILKDCLDENKNACVVVVGYDYDSEMVKVYGLNIEEWEVSDLLQDAADTTGQFVEQLMASRTLN